MNELIPILTGYWLGSMVVMVRRGLARTLWCAAAIGLGGLAAMIVSGEYRFNWAYLLIDLAEAAAGYGAGVAAARSLRWVRVALTQGPTSEGYPPKH
jgi:hypothetical protein